MQSWCASDRKDAVSRVRIWCQDTITRVMQTILESWLGTASSEYCRLWVRQPSLMWCDDTRILQSNTILPSHDSPCFVNCWQIKMIIIHLSCEIKSCVGVADGVNIINVYNLISHHLNSSSQLMLFSSRACKALLMHFIALSSCLNGTVLIRIIILLSCSHYYNHF